MFSNNELQYPNTDSTSESRSPVQRLYVYMKNNRFTHSAV